MKITVTDKLFPTSYSLLQFQLKFTQVWKEHRQVDARDTG